MSAAIPFSEVERMLSKCADGYRVRMTNHFRFIYLRDKIYHTFPKHNNIEIGHIRRMVRFFNIMDCAKQYLNI
jgi:hypothetical protein